MRGAAFAGGQLFQGIEALHLPALSGSDRDWTEALLRLNGFWALVAQTDQELIASVDRIRGVPLFYGQCAGIFFLSDDAEWVRQQINSERMDPIARDEFLLAGYVTGADTLYPGVRQLQAGEMLRVSFRNGTPEVKTTRWYRFIHAEPNQWSEIRLVEQLREVTEASMRRLVEYANGRQIVIPLSGGYDSRLIAVYLRKLKYPYVLCFTYGVAGNKEAAYSKKIADALEFKWEFVEYSERSWRESWATSDAEKYRRFSANHASLPHVQDWLAIKELQKIGRIKFDAVVVPGHSGDFVAGSHIPSFVFEKKDHTEASLLGSIVACHLSNSNLHGKSIDANELKARVRTRINEPFEGTAISFANLYELWDWQERQSKYIVNSVRVYEQFSLNWWLPLWDSEFLEFWQLIPLQLRKGRLWYKDWITLEYASTVGRSLSLAEQENASEQKDRLQFLRLMAKKIPKSFLNGLRKVRQKRGLDRHFLAFQGLITDGDVDGYISREMNIIGIYSELFIRGKWSGGN